MSGRHPVVPERRHVVVSFPVPDGALDHLAARLGPTFDVRDILTAGPEPDIVLCPSTSPQAIHRLKREFTNASVVVVEVAEWFGGPVTRAMDAGADSYFIATSPAALGDHLRLLSLDEPPEEPSPTPVGALPRGDETDAIPDMPVVEQSPEEAATTSSFTWPL